MIPKIMHSYEIPANPDKESEKLDLNKPNNYSSIDTTNSKNHFYKNVSKLCWDKFLEINNKFY